MAQLLFPCPSLCRAARLPHTSCVGIAPRAHAWGWGTQNHVCHWWGDARSCLPTRKALALTARSLAAAGGGLSTSPWWPRIALCVPCCRCYRSSPGRENMVLTLKISSWTVEFAFSVSAEGFPLGWCIKGFSAFSWVDKRIRLLIKSINKDGELLERSQCTVKRKISALLFPCFPSCCTITGWKIRPPLPILMGYGTLTVCYNVRTIHIYVFICVCMCIYLITYLIYHSTVVKVPYFLILG